MIHKFMSPDSSGSRREHGRRFEEVPQHQLRTGEDLDEEAEEDEEDRHEALDTWTWQEHEAWLAGVIARRAEEAGLIAKTDQFDWEYHQQFDASIHEAEQKVAQSNEGQTGENIDAGGSPDAASSADSGSTSGNDLGGDLASGLGSASFGDLGGFNGGNSNF